jgi:transcriptional regulator with XRE-family HTH domain
MARTHTIGDNGKQIGARIRAAREAARMSVSDLATLVGITEGAIRQVESGLVKVPSAVILLRIARELRADAHTLVFGGPRTVYNATTGPREHFRERLRRLRTERKLSVTQLGFAVGVTEGAIRQMESGQTKWPALPVAIRMAYVLGVDPRDLAFGDSDGTDLAPDATPIPRSRIDVIESALASIEARLTALERKRK